MIPKADEYLSYLMGAKAITDDDLGKIGVSIVQRFGPENRGLLMPVASLDRYKELIRQKLTPGYWNEVVGQQTIVFLFRMSDGSTRELILSDATRKQIAELCTAFNKDPIEKTSDVPRYLAGNQFYSELMTAFHGAD